MVKIVAIVFALLAGVSTALEALINGELERQTTALVATFISLFVGAIFFFLSVIISGEGKELLSIIDISPKLLLGGIFGGSIIYFTVKAIPQLGVSNTLTLIVISQILVGFFIDGFVLGTQTLHLYKFIGAVLLVIGTFFIVS